jgi:hypothetical protein
MNSTLKLILSFLFLLCLVSVFFFDFNSLFKFKKTLETDSSSSSSIIFIGGVPRSGTTLLRAILDTDPKIKCGLETRVIPDFLEILDNFLNRKINYFKKEIIDKAAINFISNFNSARIIRSERLCNIFKKKENAIFEF